MTTTPGATGAPPSSVSGTEALPEDGLAPADVVSVSPRRLGNSGVSIGAWFSDA